VNKYIKIAKILTKFINPTDDELERDRELTYLAFIKGTVGMDNYMSEIVSYNMFNLHKKNPIRDSEVDKRLDFIQMDNSEVVEGTCPLLAKVERIMIINRLEGDNV